MSDAKPAVTSQLPGIALRRAVPSDTRAVAAVFDAAVRDAWTYLGELVRRPLFPASYWDKLVADHAQPNALLVATEVALRVVGFTAVHSDDGEMFLLFVDPEYGGRGIGRLLLDAAHDVLRSSGHTEAFLFTEERNERARSFYAAAGYVGDGAVRESDFQGAALREVRLVKPL